MTKNRTRIAWSIALCVLLAALIGYNWPETETERQAATVIQPGETERPMVKGFHPGEALPDFTLKTMDGGTFRLSEYRGKVVVLNLWATWCAPCIRELPEFDRLQRVHPEDVKVLAIHSDLITDDPAAYLAEYNYGMAFAVDEGGDVIAALGGSALLPQTIVISPVGIVTYNRAGSVNLEQLEQLTAEALRGQITAEP